MQDLIIKQAVSLTANGAASRYLRNNLKWHVTYEVMNTEKFIPAPMFFKSMNLFSMCSVICFCFGIAIVHYLKHSRPHSLDVLNSGCTNATTCICIKCVWGVAYCEGSLYILGANLIRCVGPL